MKIRVYTDPVKLVKRQSLMRVLGLLLGPVFIVVAVIASLDGERGNPLNDPVTFALTVINGLVFLTYGVLGMDIDMEFGKMFQEGRERRARWRQRLAEHLNR